MRQGRGRGGGTHASTSTPGSLSFTRGREEARAATPRTRGGRQAGSLDFIHLPDNRRVPALSDGSGTCQRRECSRSRSRVTEPRRRRSTLAACENDDDDDDEVAVSRRYRDYRCKILSPTETRACRRKFRERRRPWRDDKRTLSSGSMYHFSFGV